MHNMELSLACCCCAGVLESARHGEPQLRGAPEQHRPRAAQWQPLQAGSAHGAAWRVLHGRGHAPLRLRARPRHVRWHSGVWALKLNHSLYVGVLARQAGDGAADCAANASVTYQEHCVSTPFGRSESEHHRIQTHVQRRVKAIATKIPRLVTHALLCAIIATSYCLTYAGVAASWCLCALFPAFVKGQHSRPGVKSGIAVLAICNHHSTAGHHSKSLCVDDTVFLDKPMVYHVTSIFRTGKHSYFT